MSIVKFAEIVFAAALIAVIALALLEWAYLKWVRPDCGLSEAELDAQVGSEFLEPEAGMYYTPAEVLRLAQESCNQFCVVCHPNEIAPSGMTCGICPVCEVKLRGARLFVSEETLKHPCNTEASETLEQHLAGAKKDILAEVDGMLLPPPRQNPGRFGGNNKHA